MNRRFFLLLCSALAGICSGAAAAAERNYRIGVLSRYVPRQGLARVFQALRKLGYVEGRNLVVEYRYSEERVDRLPALAADLAALPVDVILSVQNDETLAAKRATSSIPIVMLYSNVPVELGLIHSLARPGGNVTGMTVQPPETAAKMMQILKEAVPSAHHVAVIWEAGFPGMDLYRQAGESVLKQLGMRWTLFHVGAGDDLHVVFGQIARLRPDALYVVPTGPVFASRARIIEFAARERIPAFYTGERYTREGGLIGYGADFDALAERAVTYVDRILKGAKPTDLPVEQPIKYTLGINLKTAKALGLTIPQPVLLRADQLLE